MHSGTIIIGNADVITQPSPVDLSASMITAATAVLQDIYESPEDLAWKQAMAEQLRQEREYQEAWAKDPSPVDIRRGFVFLHRTVSCFDYFSIFDVHKQ